MPKKKSLADELADLFNPAPTKEFDPEADVFGAGPKLVESEDEGLGAEQPARRRAKEGGRLRGDIVLEGREYAGKRSSRAALFGEDGGSDSSDGEEAGDQQDEEALNEDSRDELSAASEEQAGQSEGSASEEEEQDHDEHGWLNSYGSDSMAAASDEEGEQEGDDEAPETAAAGSGGARRRAAAAAAASAGSDSDDDAGRSQSQDEEGRSGRGRGTTAAAAVAAAEDEMAALEQEYEQMQQDEQAALAGLKERAGKERRKALAVKAQKEVWQRGLEARILLQKALAGANRLPQGRMQAAAADTDAELAAAFSGLAADASALLGDLLALLDSLVAHNPAVAEASAATGTQRGRENSKDQAQQQQQVLQQQDGQQQQQQNGHQPALQSDALWRQVEQAYSGFAPFRDASIDRWHRKTMLTTGGAALRGGQLRALNQSISAQVATLMQDPGKVLQRTRVLRSLQQQQQHRLLCPDPDMHTAKRHRWEGEETAANGAEDNAENERDPETFDDTEFYQTLLKEFLEGSDVGGSINWHSGPKQRKAVDRRASKGRKLRYHVHDKLVGFMAPVELEAPQYAAQLFSNLFGGGSKK